MFVCVLVCVAVDVLKTDRELLYEPTKNKAS